MPTYEYECLSCKHKFEILQSIMAKSMTECPKCGKKIRKLISSSGGFIFKGPGFYATDYKKTAKSSNSGDTTTVTCPKIKDGCAGCPGHQGK